MAYAGRVRPKGSARLSFTGGVPAIVAGTNSGLFLEPPVDAGVGITTLNIDPDNPNSIAPQDTVLLGIEGVASVMGVVERVSATQLTIRTFTDAGVAADAAFAIVVNGVFQG